MPTAAWSVGNYFQIMGVQPALGRLISPEDDRIPGGHPVVVLSHAYWQRRFAGDPAIVGREITVNNTPMTVIGVAQADFLGSFLGVAAACLGADGDAGADDGSQPPRGARLRDGCRPSRGSGLASRARRRRPRCHRS